MSVVGGGTRESSLKMAVLLCGIDVSLMGFAALQSNSITILSDFFKESTDFMAVLAASDRAGRTAFTQ